MEKPTLSISMIVKNEERYLQECLESVSDVADEIVIVDTGSTDHTQEIAKNYNAKIFSFDWINDFSAARNYALSKTTGRWILYLDADERLTKDSIQEIKKLKILENKIGVRCLVNSINELGGKSNMMKYTRLFYNTPSIRFSGKVHEQIDESLISSDYKIIESGIEILHLGYNLPEEDIKIKAARNLSLLQQEYAESESSYYAYQLANTYSILEDDENAIKYYQLCLKDYNLQNEYKCVAYLNLADAELKKHNLISALKIAEKGIAADRNNPMIYILASQIYLRQNKFNTAVDYAEKAFSTNEKKSKNSFLQIGMSREKVICHLLYAALLANDMNVFNKYLHRLNKKSSLFELISNLISANHFEVNNLKTEINNDTLSLILVLLNRYTDNNFALEFLLSIKYKFCDNAKFLTTLGQMYIENNLFHEAVLTLENSLLLAQKDPAAIFYIISAYLMLNKTERVGEIINYGEKEFGAIPEFMQRLEILKQKVKPIVEKSARVN